MHILLFLIADSCLALPSLSPSSTNSTSYPSIAETRDLSGLVGGDTDRSVRDIVVSCLATILACTWVAIHPDVSPVGTSSWGRFRARAVTMAFAVFAPEFIMTWALRQRIGAGIIRDLYNERVPRKGKQVLHETHRAELTD